MKWRIFIEKKDKAKSHIGKVFKYLDIDDFLIKNSVMTREERSLAVRGERCTICVCLPVFCLTLILYYLKLKFFICFDELHKVSYLERNLHNIRTNMTNNV